VFRPYESRDLAGCLAVFDTNVPGFFRLEERDEFREFLAELPGPYLVLPDDSGRIRACGGYAINVAERTADLCWGMVRQELHGGGLGRLLTTARIDAVRRDPRVDEVALHTSQHTVGFYERLGFAIVEVRENAYAPGLHRCDMKMSALAPNPDLDP
jgi:ribosomal protein S18 acetylase RimI-like enzyme